MPDQRLQRTRDAYRAPQADTIPGRRVLLTPIDRRPEHETVTQMDRQMAVLEPDAETPWGV